MSITITTTASTSTSGGTDGARVAYERRFARGLASIIAAVVAFGLVAEVSRYAFAAPPFVVAMFSLSMERNVPTWFATCLLFACADALRGVAHARAASGSPSAPQWLALGVIFLFMSLDEAVEIHEHLAYLVEGRGVLYFSWVLPGAMLTAAIGLVFVPFLRALDPDTRRRFVVAGALYVSGALLCELPLGLWTERHGDDNLGYALIDAVEETLELLGAGYFLIALRALRAPETA